MSLYLGTTPIANTGYDKANINLSNLTSIGKNIANWSNNVSNCITEIPQDIKLELNNDGTLKLKSGSKVYISTNGTFNAVTISGDKTGAGGLWTAGHSRSLFVVVNADNNNIAIIPVEQTYSQDTAPTTFLVNQYGGWFDTANNIVKYTEDGGTTWRVCSLPICIGRPGETNVGWNGYLDQVFNGFGYIGSTVFALPGVKGLIPDGRNADGTLKNIEFTLNSVRTNLNTGTGRTEVWLNVYFAFNRIFPNAYYYDEEKNLFFTSNTNEVRKTTFIGNLTVDSLDKITSFTPKTAFHAVDYNDFNNTPHIVETYVNGTSWYRVYSDGWCEQGGQTSNNASNSSFDIDFLKNFADTNYNFLPFHTYSATGDLYQAQVDITAKTTSKITLWVASSHGTLPRIYYWTAKGYIR